MQGNSVDAISCYVVGNPCFYKCYNSCGKSWLKILKRLQCNSFAKKTGMDFVGGRSLPVQSIRHEPFVIRTFPFSNIIVLFLIRIILPSQIILLMEGNLQSSKTEIVASLKTFSSTFLSNRAITGL